MPQKKGTNINNNQMKVAIINSKINTLIFSKSTRLGIEEKIEIYNRDASKKLDPLWAIYFFDSILERISKLHKDGPDNEDEVQGYVRCCSRILRDIRSDYLPYIEFLIDNEFVEEKGKPSAQGKRCRTFRINPIWFNSDYEAIDIPAKHRIYKIETQRKQDKMKVADESCGHLTQFLNSDLTIDYKKANSYAESIYQDSPKSDKDKNRYKYYLRAIARVQKGDITYSKDGKDNRLHSNIVNLPKTVRKFLTFKGESIRFIDIKSSQPFFLSYLLYITCNIITKFGSKLNIYNWGFLYMLRKGRSITRKVLKDKQLKIEDFKEFIHLSTQEEGLYESFVEELAVAKTTRKVAGKKVTEPLIKHPNKFPILISCYLDSKDCDKQGRSYTESFDSLRGVAKYCFFRILFATSENDYPFGNPAFKKAHPKVYEFLMEYRKLTNPKSSAVMALAYETPVLSVLLQNMESMLIIDVITKKINKEYPEMPLFTIHDSIGTTPSYIDLLHSEFKRHLDELLFFSPVLVKE
jgi:Ni,Fe-hydrogenase maturation factor